MPIYKPSELHQFLESLGIAPKKGLSQNFLIDGNILKKIVASANLSKDDVVIEVGPGPGSLTEELINNQVHVIAIEKDVVLAKALERLKSEEHRLDIFCDDIMTFPLEQTLVPFLTEGRKAKVVANLPYHLTTPIIVEMVTKRHLFSHLIFMVQDEVARRFTANPGTAAYGSFTVFLNFYCRPKYAFTVNSTCFYPQPSVNSAIVILELKEPPAVSNVENFFKMTRQAFGHRRKMMRGSLKDIYASEAIEKALSEIGHSPLARPEELSLEDFIKLFERLNARGLIDVKKEEPDPWLI